MREYFTGVYAPPKRERRSKEVLAEIAEAKAVAVSLSDPDKTQRRPRFDRYGDTPDSLIDELTTLKAAAEARLSICGDDHKSAAALLRESRRIDEAVAKILDFLDKGSHQGCVPLVKHEFTIQPVTETLREYPEARKAVIAAVERAEEERNGHKIS